MKIVCVSGYFNPLTIGHLSLFKKARELGDYLIVIVNNDKQVELKGSIPFMPEDERLEIVRNIRCVDWAILAKDKNRSVAKTIKFVKPHIFANGGDVNSENHSEEEKNVCKEIGCEIVYGVGGSEKIQSSSSLIKRALEYVKQRNSFSNSKTSKS